MLRITGGRLKGRKLLTQKGKATRPTLEKTREAIFNTLQSRYDLERYEAYDLFAGSGALGFEAFSRGASGTIFIETNKKNRSLILANIKDLSLEKHCRVLLEDAVRWLKRQKWSGEPKLFLIDPPYESRLAQQTVDSLASRDDIPVQSLMVLETARDWQVAYPDNFSVFSQKQFGKTRLDFIEIQSASEK
ncbi:MAG: 16S rRNA (guanine(966)-N(2))-methyltransferase RsmD [Proteobacteria bacterium]|nr:16S rRNA (guanine(966)-N(2))-methyltransferase RsmD [Pseudomonadota bacterium]